MATSHDSDAQAIVAFYIGPGLTQQGQCLWCIDVGALVRLDIDQTVQKIQHMRFGCHALIQSQFYSPDGNLFVVMKDVDEDTSTSCIRRLLKVRDFSCNGRLAGRMILVSYAVNFFAMERSATLAGRGYGMSV